MSTSDRSSAGGGVSRPPADDAAPAALSLPHEERLALARRLLTRGEASSGGGTALSAAAEPSDAAPRTTERRSTRRAAGTPHRDRDSAAESGAPWSDPLADDDPSDVTPPRPRAGRIRRTPGAEDPWGEADEASVRASEARAADRAAAARAFAADTPVQTPARAKSRRAPAPADSADATGSPDDHAPQTTPSRIPARTRGAATQPVDPWGESDDSAAGAPTGASPARGRGTPSPAAKAGRVGPTVDEDGGATNRVDESAGADGLSVGQMYVRLGRMVKARGVRLPAGLGGVGGRDRDDGSLVGVGLGGRGVGVRRMGRRILRWMRCRIRSRWLGRFCWTS